MRTVEAAGTRSWPVPGKGWGQSVSKQGDKEPDGAPQVCGHQPCSFGERVSALLSVSSLRSRGDGAR